MDRIAGRHALITGGASGIGLAVARALNGEGASVTIADYDRERLGSLAGEFNCLALDVRDRGAWAIAKQSAEAALGPVAILCNNAGVAVRLK